MSHDRQAFAAKTHGGTGTMFSGTAGGDNGVRICHSRLHNRRINDFISFKSKEMILNQLW